MSRIALFAAAALWAGCAVPGTGAPLSLLPEEADNVLIVDFAGLRATPLWRDARAEFAHVLASDDLADEAHRLGARWDDLVHRAGFDPLEDVDRIVIGLGPTRGARTPGLIVLDGRNFEGPRVAASVEHMAGKKFVTVERRGVTVFEAEPGEDFAAAFPTSRRALAGSPEWVDRAIDRRRRSMSGGAGAGAILAAALGRAAPGAHVVLAARVDEGTRGMMERGTALPGLGDVRAITVSLTGATDLACAVVFDTGAVDRAAALAVALQDGVDAAARAIVVWEGVEMRRLLLKVVAGVTVRAEGTLVRVDADLAPLGGAVLAGRLAALAIPAFQRYLARAAAAGSSGRPPGDDLAPDDPPPPPPPTDEPEPGRDADPL